MKQILILLVILALSAVAVNAVTQCPVGNIADICTDCSAVCDGIDDPEECEDVCSDSYMEDLGTCNMCYYSDGVCMQSEIECDCTEIFDGVDNDCDEDVDCNDEDLFDDPECSVFDLGDAPDSSNTGGNTMTTYGVTATFPTVFAAGSPPYGPIHNTTLAWLGTQWSSENEADIGSDVDGVNNLITISNIADQDSTGLTFGMDDGLKYIPLNTSTNNLKLPHCVGTTIPVEVTKNVAGDYYLNVWIDYNQDGNWGTTSTADTILCDTVPVSEWVVQNHVVSSVGNFIETLSLTGYSRYTGEMWMRVKFTPVAVANADGSGPSSQDAAENQDGETEDYLAYTYECSSDDDCPGGYCTPRYATTAAAVSHITGKQYEEIGPLLDNGPGIGGDCTSGPSVPEFSSQYMVVIIVLLAGTMFLLRKRK